jgi:glycosyltransferase involved in cell wall biosynthesis
MTAIANGIDLQRFRKAIPSAEITQEEGYHILMVAAFRPPKDHASLIRALSFLPKDYHLHLAGGSETDHDRQTLMACQNLVRDLNLEDRVRFLGVRMDIPELIAASNVVVLSTFYEGFGLSALEAMAAAKPVVASDVPGLSDLVGGAGVLVSPGEPEALARTIQEICEKPDKAREIGRRCQERAQKYDIDETARQYRRLYQNL